MPTPKISSRAPNAPAEEYLKDAPPLYKLRRYYLPSELSEHNTSDNCWVSFFNQVFDLSKLIAENSDSPLCDPIVLAAGTDITHWFDPLTQEVSQLTAR